MICHFEVKTICRVVDCPMTENDLGGLKEPLGADQRKCLFIYLGGSGVDVFVRAQEHTR
jgi:hypothetical protein